MALEIGDKAPPFTALRDGGGEFSFSNNEESATVLYFYPRDDTAGCTKEAIEFTTLLPQFREAHVRIIGVSKDSVKKHDKFRDKYDLGIILVSDEQTMICEDYGFWVEKSMYGKTYMGIERSTFLIAPDGKIKNIWRKVKAAGHAEVVLAEVKSR